MLCFYSPVKILHSVYCSTQLSSSMWWSSRWGQTPWKCCPCILSQLGKYENFGSLYGTFPEDWEFFDAGILKLADAIEMVATFHNKKWKEVKKQFQFVDSPDSFSTSSENPDLQCFSKWKNPENSSLWFWFHLSMKC